MKSKQWFSWMSLVVLVAAALTLGCGGAGATNSKDDGDTVEASPAKNEQTDESGSEKAEGKRKKGKDGKDGEDEKKEEAVPIEVASIEAGPIASVLAFSANLEAESEVSVVAEAQRQVVDLLVEEGDRVRRGQVLLRLEDDEQRSALAKVKSQVEKAEREFERQERLYKQDLISEEEYNNANYELAQLKIEQADAERELGYTEVQAPISGTITSRLVSLGDQVQIGQELFSIIDFDSIVARVYVPEKHLPALHTGLPAHVKAQAATGLQYDCSVKRIAPIVDPKSGTVKVTVSVGAQPGLRPGMYVDVNLITATRDDALLIPKRAIVYDDDQMYVYRMKGKDRVERVFIEPRLVDKYNVEPAAGFAAGDRVVVAGQAGLKEGALVRLPGNESDAKSATPEETAEAAEVQRAAL